MTEAKQKPSSNAQAIVALAIAAGLELFHDGAGAAYARSPRGETWRVSSPAFRRWLRHLLHTASRQAPSTVALEDAISELVARAEFDGPRFPVSIRIARAGGAVYVDLGDPEWRVACVDATGWRIITGSECPVRFRRPPAMQPLPTPVVGGRLDELRTYINLDEDDEQWALVAAFLVSVFLLAPSGPFPILMFQGEQGSAKTSCTERCAALIDPRKGGLRALSQTLDALAVAAENGFLVGFDNVSTIPMWMSDGLCRLATGSGFGKRTHYADEEETILEATRPIIMNGIGQAALKLDLVDRGVLVELPPVPPERRRTRRQLVAAFEAARPRIIGALLDAVAVGLRNESAVLSAAESGGLPRMADFAVSAMSAEPAFGVAAGTFSRAYNAALAAGNEDAALDDPLAIAVQHHVRIHGRLDGSATQLLALLPRPLHVDSASWPASATKMGNRLVRLRPGFPLLGVSASYSRTNATRVWHFIQAEPPAGDSSDTRDTSEEGSTGGQP